MIVLYAIVAGRPRLPRGFVHVKAGGANVVVKKGKLEDPTREAIAAYDEVIRSLASKAVLPFRFGTSVATADALEALLEPLAPSIERALERVRECVQYTHRVYGKALPPPKRRRGQGPGAAFMAQKLHAVRAPEIARLLAAVAPSIREQRIERHDRAPLVASVYHLVALEKERAYRRALEKAERGAYRVETTGPWPAYAFAELA